MSLDASDAWDGGGEGGGTERIAKATSYILLPSRNPCFLSSSYSFYVYMYIYIEREIEGEGEIFSNAEKVKKDVTVFNGFRRK